MAKHGITFSKYSMLPTMLDKTLVNIGW